MQPQHREDGLSESSIPSLGKSLEEASVQNHPNLIEKPPLPECEQKAPAGWFFFRVRHLSQLAAAISRNRLRILAIGSLLALIIGLTLLSAANIWAYYHFRAGQAASKHFHANEALPHFQSALKIWPKDPATLLLAARNSRQLNHSADAETYLEKYREVAGTTEELILEQVLLRAQTGEIDKVEPYCLNRLKQDDDTKALVLEAMVRGYLREFRWTQAEERLAQWLESEPNNPQAYLLKGYIENELQNPSEAAEAYRRVLQLDPEHLEARLRLGELLLDLTQADEALPHLEYLRRRQPDNLLGSVALARCYDQVGRQHDAESLLDEILAKNPNSFDAQFLRGRIAMRSERKDEAEVWLRRACALEPGDFQANYQLYQCLEKQGKSREAQEMTAVLKQIDSDLKRSNEIATRLLQLTPHDPSLLQEMGEIMLRAGKESEGLRWLSRALKENNRHAPTHKALASFYKKKGDAKLANLHREQAGVEAGK